jgi:hypothetical protein
MSYISAFEQHSRDTLAISVLNKFRRWLIGRDKHLPDNKNKIVAKAISALNGDIDLNDAISYYFKDSGEINNSVIVQLSKVFAKVLDNKPEQKQRFCEAVSNFLKTGKPGQLNESDTGFVRDVIERSIFFIDNELTNMKTSLERPLADTKGF